MLRALLGFLLTLPLAAQGMTFTPKRPLVRVTADNLPALIAAAMQGRLGRLLAEPDVRAAANTCIARDQADVARWTNLVKALAAEAPRSVPFDERAELALRGMEWREVHSFDLSAALANPDAEAQWGAGLQGATQPAVTLALHPVPNAAKRWHKRFADFVAEVRTNPPYQLDPAPVDPATTDVSSDTPQSTLELRPNENSDPAYEAASFGSPPAPHVWAIQRPGLIAGGSLTRRAGRFVPRSTRQPSLSFGVDLQAYAAMFARITSSAELSKVFEATAIANSRLLEWRLRAVEDRMQDEFHWSFEGEIGGILGALLSAVAPLPGQPLPEGAMLQLRTAFDVPALTAAVDRLLVLGRIRTLAEDQMHEDLRLAWTGGMAFSVTSPAPGGLVPRLYASFGIVDQEALQRLLARLRTQPWLEARNRKLNGVDCTLLQISGLPAALSPAYCIVDDIMHIAESAGSLRALLKARSAGAPMALPIGDAPRPQGEGLLSPAFDLRYDNATIHRTVRKVWLPLMTTMIAAVDSDNFLHLDDLPDSELVAKHLGPGRGVLRRTKNGVSLAMSGTIGGPALTALATVFGPALSSAFTEQRNWVRGDLMTRLAIPRMTDIEAARTTFVAREGRQPQSLGELVANGDIAKDRLVLPEATEFEPVMHGGKELGKTSFRFYPEGLPAVLAGHESELRLITIQALPWYRIIMAADRSVHLGSGDISRMTLDEIEGIGEEKAGKR